MTTLKTLLTTFLILTGVYTTYGSAGTTYIQTNTPDAGWSKCMSGQLLCMGVAVYSNAGPQIRRFWVDPSQLVGKQQNASGVITMDPIQTRLVAFKSVDRSCTNPVVVGTVDITPPYPDRIDVSFSCDGTAVIAICNAQGPAGTKPCTFNPQ